MFFFIPSFVDTAPRARQQSLPKTLPRLPLPGRVDRSVGSAGDSIFSQSIGGAAEFGVNTVQQVLSALTSSLTALGNRTNVYFTQIATALAWDRAARNAAAMFGTTWPSFGAMGSFPPSVKAGWPVQSPSFNPMTWFANPWLVNPWAAANPWTAFEPAANPWAAAANAFEAWSRFWMPTTSPQPGSRTYGRPTNHPPLNTTFSMPGFSASFTWGTA